MKKKKKIIMSSFEKKDTLIARVPCLKMLLQDFGKVLFKLLRQAQRLVKGKPETSISKTNFSPAGSWECVTD